MGVDFYFIEKEGKPGTWNQRGRWGLPYGIQQIQQQVVWLTAMFVVVVIVVCGAGLLARLYPTKVIDWSCSGKNLFLCE